MTTTIRPARPEDLDVLVHFQEQMAIETEEIHLDRTTLQRGIRALLEDPSRGSYFVAEHASRAAGCLMITREWSDWRAGWVWWIQSVWVDPDQRGRGIYRALYDHVKELANRDDEVRGIRLYVDRRNTAAQDVYARLGMDGEHYRVFEWMK